MNTKILKKISAKVKFEIDEYGIYNIFLYSENGVWHKVLSSIKVDRALHRKHTAWLAAINVLGYTGYLLGRRKKRQRQRIKRNAQVKK